MTELDYAVERLTAYVRDFGDDKQPAFIADMRLVLAAARANPPAEDYAEQIAADVQAKVVGMSYPWHSENIANIVRAAIRANPPDRPIPEPLPAEPAEPAENFATAIKQADEESKQHEPCMSLQVCEEGQTVELYLDTSANTYSEWIPAEGGDIGLMRDQESKRVMGVRLPLYCNNLAVFHEGPLRINAWFKKESEPEPEQAGESVRLDTRLPADQTPLTPGPEISTKSAEQLGFICPRCKGHNRLEKIDTADRATCADCQFESFTPTGPPAPLFANYPSCKCGHSKADHEDEHDEVPTGTGRCMKKCGCMQYRPIRPPAPPQEPAAAAGEDDDPKPHGAVDAHPLWQRGYNQAMESCATEVDQILGGLLFPGKCAEPWESVRQRLVGLVQENDRLKGAPWHEGVHQAWEAVNRILDGNVPTGTKGPVCERLVAELARLKQPDSSKLREYAEEARSILADIARYLARLPRDAIQPLPRTGPVIVEFLRQPIPSIEPGERTEIEQIQAQADGWKEAAEQNCRDVGFYRSLLVNCAALCGPDVYVSDDGSVQQDPLLSKVPECLWKAIHQQPPVEPGEPWRSDKGAERGN